MDLDFDQGGQMDEWQELDQLARAWDDICNSALGPGFTMRLQCLVAFGNLISSSDAYVSGRESSTQLPSFSPELAILVCAFHILEGI